MLFAEELLSKKRCLEAARVFIDYADDIRQSVLALAQGNEFSEARRIVSASKSLGGYLVHLIRGRCHYTRCLNSLKT